MSFIFTLLAPGKDGNTTMQATRICSSIHYWAPTPQTTLYWGAILLHRKPFFFVMLRTVGCHCIWSKSERQASLYHEIVYIIRTIGCSEVSKLPTSWKEKSVSSCVLKRKSVSFPAVPNVPNREVDQISRIAPNRSLYLSFIPNSLSCTSVFFHARLERNLRVLLSFEIF